MANTRAIVLSLESDSTKIEIDSCLEETHELANTVTDHPVEEGFNVSDHSRPNPDLVSLKCFISNTPLSSEQVKRAVSSGAVDFETSAAAAVSAVIGDADGRGNDAFVKLKKMRDESGLIKLVTSVRTYGGDSSKEAMLIESISIPRTTKNFDGLEFSLKLKQIRIVRNRSTRAPRQKDKRTIPKKQKGGADTRPLFGPKFNQSSLSVKTSGRYDPQTE